VLDTNIFAMTGTDRNEVLWVADEGGRMKCLDIRENNFIRNYVISSKAVYCICIVQM
jgi:hypothetical protein